MSRGEFHPGGLDTTREGTFMVYTVITHLMQLVCKLYFAKYAANLLKKIYIVKTSLRLLYFFPIKYYSKNLVINSDEFVNK